MSSFTLQAAAGGRLCLLVGRAARAGQMGCTETTSHLPLHISATYSIIHLASTWGSTLHLATDAHVPDDTNHCCCYS
ncbi:hypothetical protein E2C01_048531 [Portunus trituberculatus]|uniref:Uncharacterized protein n=1 Tax=Portunus trituberculatus TaxID=210409 RepID=A0A5B7GBW1_PORTR|nr:hypothetical protein [Portunus trituberculatus]